MSVALLAACILATACGGGSDEPLEPLSARVQAQAADTARTDASDPEVAVAVQQATQPTLAATVTPDFAVLAVDTSDDSKNGPPAQTATAAATDGDESAAAAQAASSGAPQAKKPAALEPVITTTAGSSSTAVIVTVPATQAVSTEVTLLRLASLSTPTSATSSLIGAPAGCREGFVPGASLQAGKAVATPATGGATFTALDQVRWDLRTTAATLVAANGTDKPNDWPRIAANARSFISGGEAAVNSSNRGTHGMKARDAAFYQRVASLAGAASAVRNYLLTQAAAPENDFSTLCFRNADGSAPYDAYFEQAAWLLRYTVTYDYMRAAMSEGERLPVENYIRRQGYFLAAHLDWNLRMIFPNRLQGDYATRARDAKPANANDTWATRQFDTNGDCKVNSSDDSTAYPVYAYVDADGNRGPRLSRLSLWYNNRKSAAALAFGTVGLVLGDEALVNRAKRYVMEWLTYSVWSDGSEGEYYRNGDYCIPKQGLIYAQYNLQAAALLAHWTAQNGDASLARFATTDGLFGSESTNGVKKSISSVMATELGQLGGSVRRYFHEGWRSTQQPREATSFGKIDSNYMNGGKWLDNFHELGLLATASTFTSTPIRGTVLREAIALRRPGATGNAVTTGYGQWMDVFGALPAVMLLN